ncbi:MAG TPA: hypothetical protein VF975_11120 [Thermoanaerobaculia bacterium]
MSGVNAGRLTQIYDAYRSALLNKKYYACQLDFYRKLNRSVEIILAIATPSTVGGWAIWHTQTGQTIWAVIAAIVALVAALKPVFDWPKDIDRYSRLHAEHTVQFYTLKQLVEDIEMHKTITPEMEKRFLDARDRHAQLSKDDDVKPSKRVARRCEREVKAEIPSDRLWIPNKGETS